MLAFVDESGDSGMKGKPGSSAKFVVTLLWFEDHDDATACDRSINSLRSSMGLSPAFEFHFSKCCNAYRTRFLQHAANHQFFYMSFVLNKALLTGPGFAYKSSFYKWTVNTVFANAKPYLTEAIVVMDETGSAEFKSQLARYLRNKMTDDDGRCAIKKVKMQKSHGNNLLQLVDMVCGAVARSFSDTAKNRHHFRSIVRENEMGVQEWPKK